MPSYEPNSPYIITDFQDVDIASDCIRWSYGVPAISCGQSHGIVASASTGTNAYYPRAYPDSHGISQGYPSQGRQYPTGLSLETHELPAATQPSFDCMSTSDPHHLSVTEGADVWLYQGRIPTFYESSYINALQSEELWCYSDADVSNAIFTADSPVDNICSELEECDLTGSRQGSIEKESSRGLSSSACDKLDPIPPHMFVPSQQPMVDYRIHGFSRMQVPYRAPQQPGIGQVPVLGGPNSPDTYSDDSPSPQTPGFFDSAESSSSPPNLPFDFEHENDEYANHRVQYSSQREVFSTFSSELKDALDESKAQSSQSSLPRVKNNVERDVRQPSIPPHSLIRTSTGKSKGLSRVAGAPYPPSSARVSSPGTTKKSTNRKPSLACLFCRGRKITCGALIPGSTNKTCNQCARRQLKCEYALESRRGMRTSAADANGIDVPAKVDSVSSG